MADNDIKTDYLQSLFGIEPLTMKEEHALGARIAKGDSLALDKLVTHNLRFVPHVVCKTTYWQHGKMPLEDLLAIGNEQLLIAAKRWKPMKHIRFSAFARSFILRGLQRELDNTANIIRLPINIMEELKRMNYNERMLLQELGRKPMVSEIAKTMDVKESRIHQLKGFIAREPVSLDNIENDKFFEENDD